MLKLFLIYLISFCFYSNSQVSDSSFHNTFGINFNYNLQFNFSDITSQFKTYEAYLKNTEYKDENITLMKPDNSGLFQNLTTRYAFDIHYAKKLKKILPKIHSSWIFGFNFISSKFRDDFYDAYLIRYDTFIELETNQIAYNDTVKFDYYNFVNKTKSYSILNEFRIGTNPNNVSSINLGFRNIIGISINSFELTTNREQYLSQVVDDQLGLVNDISYDYEEDTPIEDIYNSPYHVIKFEKINKSGELFNKTTNIPVNSNLILGFALPLQFNTLIFKLNKSSKALYFNVNYMYNLNMIFIPERKEYGLKSYVTYYYSFAGIGFKFKL
jgi:hypothetical protein